MRKYASLASMYGPYGNLYTPGERFMREFAATIAGSVDSALTANGTREARDP